LASQGHGAPTPWDEDWHFQAKSDLLDRTILRLKAEPSLRIGMALRNEKLSNRPEELWDRIERRLHCRLSRRRRWRVLDTSGVLHKAVKPMLRRGATSKWWIAEKRNALPETIELYHMAAEVLDWLRFHISELGREPPIKSATYQDVNLALASSYPSHEAPYPLIIQD
jgi:hypothetical protein